MKCPLFHSEFIRMRSPELEQPDDCLEEECAWWDWRHGACSIKAIRVALAEIAHSLADIASKTPLRRI